VVRTIREADHFAVQYLAAVTLQASADEAIE
jgi:hypothetical protein